VSRGRKIGVIEEKERKRKGKKEFIVRYILLNKGR
jgi:hypothetical protein